MIIKELKIQIKNIGGFGQLCFYLGTFFLASALPIAGIFYLIALFTSIHKTKRSILKDGWNQILIVSSGFILFSSIKTNLFHLQNNTNEIQYSSSWYSLFNWIPLFLIFIYFQHYLKNKDQRSWFSKILISGTFPVFFSCLLQYKYRLYGPWETFGGLIVWFNKPIYGIDGGAPFDGLSGLFSNPNYLGFWLSTIFPLIVALILENKFFNYKKFFTIGLSLLTVILILYTRSRNAILNLFVTSFLIFGLKNLLIAFIIIIVIFFFVDLLKFGSIFPEVFARIGSLFYSQYLRFNIWSNTVKLIAQRPIFGYGAATFPIYFSIRDIGIQHTHNLPLQIAYDYGILNSIILTLFVTFLVFRGYQAILEAKSYKGTNIFNRCWLIASFATIFHHFFDITYYDGKISILIWILLAGLKCIIDECKKSKKYV